MADQPSDFDPDKHHIRVGSHKRVYLGAYGWIGSDVLMGWLKDPRFVEHLVRVRDHCDRLIAKAAELPRED